MEQMANDSSSLSRGAGLVCYIALGTFFKEKAQVRSAPEPPSSAKKAKFLWSSYMKDDLYLQLHKNRVHHWLLWLTCKCFFFACIISFFFTILFLPRSCLPGCWTPDSKADSLASQPSYDTVVQCKQYQREVASSSGQDDGGKRSISSCLFTDLSSLYLQHPFYMYSFLTQMNKWIRILSVWRGIHGSIKYGPIWVLTENYESQIII